VCIDPHEGRSPRAKRTLLRLTGGGAASCSFLLLGGLVRVFQMLFKFQISKPLQRLDTGQASRRPFESRDEYFFFPLLHQPLRVEKYAPAIRGIFFQCFSMEQVGLFIILEMISDFSHGKCPCNQGQNLKGLTLRFVGFNTGWIQAVRHFPHFRLDFGPKKYFEKCLTG
jgi:hypothetical protein